MMGFVLAVKVGKELEMNGPSRHFKSHPMKRLLLLNDKTISILML